MIGFSAHLILCIPKKSLIFQKVKLKLEYKSDLNKSEANGPKQQSC